MMLSAEHPLDPVVKYLQRKLTILSNHHVFYLSKYISIFSEPLVKKIVKSFNALKVKIFVWQLRRDRLPSGVGVAKCHGPDVGLCPSCVIPGSETHIIFSCSAARFIWSFISEVLINYA